MSKDSPPQPPPPDILKKFQDDWNPQLYNRLVYFANGRCKRLYWHGVLGGPAREGQTGEDFVQDAIRLFFEGRRQWNPEKCDLKKFLEGVVYSITGHSAENNENTDTVRNSPKVDENGNEQDIISQIADDQLPYEEQEEVALRETLLFGFMESLENEPELFKVFELIYEGENKPAKIAEKLGIKVKEVNNIQKRLKTKAGQFKKARSLAMKK